MQARSGLLPLQYSSCHNSSALAALWGPLESFSFAANSAEKKGAAVTLGPFSSNLTAVRSGKLSSTALNPSPKSVQRDGKQSGTNKQQRPNAC